MKDLWNILEKPWIDAAALDGAWRLVSPLDALRDAASIRRIAASSPLDEFAALRFLTTLAYWKAQEAGGLAAVRAALLARSVPSALVAAVAAARDQFNLLDPNRPFLQDPSAADSKPGKPVGSLFAEIATGTNIAHFDHSRDFESPICLPCVARGVLRLVPWSQSGGSGLTPSIHGAPPIAILPRGATLAETLGHLLVDVPAPLGSPTWSGRFASMEPSKPIPLLEALTWNPRRVHVPAPSSDGRCHLCGTVGPVVAAITFKKNDGGKKQKNSSGKPLPFLWRDPAFLYSQKSTEPIRSRSESEAGDAQDLKSLRETASSSSIISSSCTPTPVVVVIPSTNPANNKTFDHRRIEVESIADLPARPHPAHGAAAPELEDSGLQPRAVGWADSHVPDHVRAGIVRLASSAVLALGDFEWLALRRASGLAMNDAPEAFAVFSAIFWRARSGTRSAFDRDAAWILLKLMALAPSEARGLSAHGDLGRLLEALPTTQATRARSEPSSGQRYPIAPPRGNALELLLTPAVDRQVALGAPVPWIELGAFLHNASR